MRTMIAVAVALMLSGAALFAADQSSQQGGMTGGSSDQQMSQQGGTTGGGSSEEMGQEKTITATVDNVNKGQKKITVTGSKGNKAEYTLNDTTVITTKSGEQMQIGDLKPGSKVTIMYTGTKENPNVTKVEVKKGK